MRHEVSPLAGKQLAPGLVPDAIGRLHRGTVTTSWPRTARPSLPSHSRSASLPKTSLPPALQRRHRRARPPRSRRDRRPRRSAVPPRARARRRPSAAPAASSASAGFTCICSRARSGSRLLLRRRCRCRACTAARMPSAMSPRRASRSRSRERPSSFSLRRPGRGQLDQRVVLEDAAARHVAALGIGLAEPRQLAHHGEELARLGARLDPLPGLVGLGPVGGGIGQDRHLLGHPALAPGLLQPRRQRLVDRPQVRHVGQRVAQLRLATAAAATSR